MLQLVNQHPFLSDVKSPFIYSFCGQNLTLGYSGEMNTFVFYGTIYINWIIDVN